MTDEAERVPSMDYGGPVGIDAILARLDVLNVSIERLDVQMDANEREYATLREGRRSAEAERTRLIAKLRVLAGDDA